MRYNNLKWIILIFTPFILLGCSEINEPQIEFENSTEEVEEIEIYDFPETIFLDMESASSNSDETGLSYSEFIFAKTNQNTRSSSTSSDILKAVGYTNMTKQSTGKRMFKNLPKGHVLQNYTTYPYTRYIFGNRVTIPHGSTMQIPTKEFPTDYPTGFNPDNLSKAGYKYISISESSNGDVYELQTIIDVIEYNVSGQNIGKIYYPFRVGNPSTDMYFEYAWSMNNWFN